VELQLDHHQVPEFLEMILYLTQQLQRVVVPEVIVIEVFLTLLLQEILADLVEVVMDLILQDQVVQQLNQHNH
jgi:hypothetical protein